ncbi:MAG TPA: universal stress protein [Candidatus Baltobacteraceae bacterium]|nr:universal stress protein [Candidatus Baltobacteraceae bacterium]
MIRTVLVATDGSDEAMAAVRKAVELTLSLGAGAELHIVSVVSYADIPSALAKQPPNAPDLLAEQAQEALQLAAAAAFASGIPVQTHLATGEIVPSILTLAQAVGADLLVAGFRGRNRIVRLVMGSAVGTLVRSTTIPVMVVREPE